MFVLSQNSNNTSVATHQLSLTCYWRSVPRSISLALNALAKRVETLKQKQGKLHERARR